MADHVKTFATHKQVFTGATEQGVVVEATNQGVAATSTLHPVGTAQTGDAVVALLAQEHIGVAVNITADQGVVTLSSIEVNHGNSTLSQASLKRVVAITAGEHSEELGQAGEGVIEPVTKQRATEGNAVSVRFIQFVVTGGAVVGDDEAQLAAGIVISGGEAEAPLIEAGLEIQQILIDSIEENQRLGRAYAINDRIDAQYRTSQAQFH